MEKRTMAITDTQFLAKLKEVYPQLTPREKLVAEFLSENMQLAAFLTCVEFGKAAGVSDTTVIRLANVLGFDGYSQMKKQLQGLVRRKLSSQDKLSDTIDRISESNFLHEIYELEKQNLEQTYRSNDPHEIELAVKNIGQADKIFIMGLGLSVSVVRFLSLRLRRIGKDVVELTGSGFSLVEKLASYRTEDLLIAFDFPKYSVDVQQTLKFMKQKNSGTSLLITDNHLGEHAQHADIILTARNESLGFANSIIGTTMLCNMLSVGAALQNQDDSLEQLSSNEAFAELLGHSY